MATRAELELLMQLRDEVSRGLQNIQGELRQTDQSARGLKSVLGGAVSTATGFLAAEVGMRAFGAATDFVRQNVFGMNASLETANLQFETLMRDSDRAQEHVRSLFDFAKRTPFETAPIIETSRLLRTFGGDLLDTEQNLGMVGDAAAGTSNKINEVGFWTGRAYSMIQSGKPFGEAAMRLQEMGILSADARAHMEALQKQGASADEVWAVFTQDLDRFSGSMDRMAGTWTGVTSTIADSIGILSADALRPLFDLTKAILGEVADFLNSPIAEQGAQAIASSIEGALQEGATALEDFLNGVFTMESETAVSLGRMAGFFLGFLDIVSDWGAEIVRILAQGIVGAADLAAQAIQFLGEVITFWMAPSSPPRFLPDLQKWARGTMDAYFSEWSNADLSAVEDLGRQITSILRSFGAAGSIDQEDLFSTILGSRELVAQAIADVREFGSVSQATLMAIRQAAGPAGDEIAGLVERYGELHAVTQQISETQARLNEVRRQQADVEAEGELEGLRSLLTQESLSPERRKEIEARIEEIELEKELRRLEAERDAAASELDAYESRLNIETETLDLIGQQNAFLDRLTGSVRSMVKSLKDAVDPLVNQLRGYQLQSQELQSLIQLAQARAVLEDEEATAAEKAAAQIAIKRIETERLIRAQEAADLGVDLSWLEDVPIVWEDIHGKTGEAKGALDEWGGAGETGAEKIRAAIEETRTAIANLSLDLESARERVAEIRRGFEEGKEAVANMRSEVNQLLERLGLISTEVEAGTGARALSPLEVRIRELKELWNSFMQDLQRGGEVEGGTGAVSSDHPIMRFLTWLRDESTRQIGDISTTIDTSTDTWELLFGDYATNARGALEPWFTWATTTTQNTLQAFDLMHLARTQAAAGHWDDWRLTVGGILDLFGENTELFFTTLFESIAGLFGIKLPELKAGIQSFSDEAIASIQSMSDTIAETLQAMIDDALAAIFGEEGLIQKIKSEAEEFQEAGKKLVEELKEGFKDEWDDFIEWIKGKLRNWRDLLPFSEPRDRSSPLYGLSDAGAAAVAELQKGVDRMTLELPGISGLETVTPLAAVGPGRTGATTIVYELNYDIDARGSTLSEARIRTIIDDSVDRALSHVAGAADVRIRARSFR